MCGEKVCSHQYFSHFWPHKKKPLEENAVLWMFKNTMKAYISVLLFFSKRRNEPFAQKRIMCKKGKYIYILSVEMVFAAASLDEIYGVRAWFTLSRVAEGAG